MFFNSLIFIFHRQFVETYLMRNIYTTSQMGRELNCIFPYVALFVGNSGNSFVTWDECKCVSYRASTILHPSPSPSSPSASLLIISVFWVRFSTFTLFPNSVPANTEFRFQIQSACGQCVSDVLMRTFSSEDDALKQRYVKCLTSDSYVVILQANQDKHPAIGILCDVFHSCPWLVYSAFTKFLVKFSFPSNYIK